MLQKANRRSAAEKAVRKMEAGAIAFVVAQTMPQHRPLTTPTCTSTQFLTSGRELGVIQRTSSAILSALESPTETTGEVEPELRPSHLLTLFVVPIQIAFHVLLPLPSEKIYWLFSIQGYRVFFRASHARSLPNEQPLLRNCCAFDLSFWT